MKTSSYIYQIAKTNILKKGQRTWLSLISILLSTAIIFTSLTLFINLFTFSKNVDYDELGNYHYAACTNEEIRPSNRYNMTKDMDTSYYGSQDENFYNWRILEVEKENPVLPFTIKEGVLPSNSNEVMISEKWNIKVGSQIQLNKTFVEDSNISKSLYQLINLNNLDISNNDSYKVVGVYKANDAFYTNTNNYDIIYTYSTQEEITNTVYYIQDEQIHITGSFNNFINRFHVSEDNVISNMEVISNDSVKNFLQDTTVILVMFIMIMVIGVCVSLISVQNVLIISDKDRKKELGLLKSIGATPNEIKKLIQIELIFLGIVGSLLGIVLGAVISYFVLNLFIEKIYITFKYSMILNPFVIVASIISGIALMYFSGTKAYQKYYYTSAISDLKDFSYDYAEPVLAKNRRQRTFAWRMFVIYNGRMKKQTRNVFHSFTLFLFTCILFMSTFLSNGIYVQKYVKKGFDFDISAYVNGQVKSEPIPEFAYELYKSDEKNEFSALSVYTERIMVSSENFFWTLEEEYDENLLSSYEATARIDYKTKKDNDGNVWCNLYHFPVALDKVQLEEIKQYVVEGSLDNLSVNDVISIQNKTDRLGSQLCTNLHVGDKVGWDTIENQKTVAAVIVIPEEAYEGKHFNYEDYPRVLAYSLEELIANGNSADISEHTYIKLKNATSAASAFDLFDEILIKTNAFETYFIDPVALTIETNRFATFILEALLYPLFLMLFIVSLMNLNNVFIGNVHLKRGDISVMKSVGMTDNQLSMLFTFEYIEGYINASLVSIAVFFPIVFLERLIGLPSVYQFGSNIFGTLIIALFFFAIILITPLIYISLRRIRAILPIENLKNVD